MAQEEDVNLKLNAIEEKVRKASDSFQVSSSSPESLEKAKDEYEVMKAEAIDLQEALKNEEHVASGIIRKMWKVLEKVDILMKKLKEYRRETNTGGKLMWTSFLGFESRAEVVSMLLMPIGQTWIRSSLQWFNVKDNIKENVSQICNENKASMEASTARIQDQIRQEDTQNLTKISSLPWSELTEGLRSGYLTAITVLIAYQAAALDAHNKTNCIVSWVEDAETQAKMLDTIPVWERGPLHGVPVSVKECYNVAGTYSTAGMAKFARNIAEEDSDVVKMIKKLGGVPFCKTNVPQAMISLQCSNPIYGTTTNPHGEDRECGGSSGGEASLAGGAGSILGLGSDIGGSLRNPAAFCGCYTMKPTTGRHLSQDGVVNPTGAHPVGITPLGGFITPSAAALEGAWRIVWGKEREGTSQPRWDQGSYDKKPKIGYFTTDGILDPAVGCVRAVTEAVAKLEKAGFQTVKIESPDIHEIMHYFNGIILAEIDSAELFKNLKYDVVDSTLNGMIEAINFHQQPWFIKMLFNNNTRIFPLTSAFNTTSKLCQGIFSKDTFTKTYLEQMDSLGVDIILCPAQLLPAPPTGIMGNFLAGVSPYIPWNVMNFPAGIAPITKWSQEDEDKMKGYQTEYDEQKIISNNCQHAHGLPLAVQVVGRPFEDEQVLRILTELEISRGKVASLIHLFSP